MDDELAQFCRREHPRLVGALDLVCGSLGLAEDLAQETLARICRDWAKVRRLDAPGAYAHRVAMNLAVSAFRRRAAERRAHDKVGRRASDMVVLTDGADAVAVRSALAALRPEQRQVLVARYYLGYDVNGTADVLRLPVGTVKTHTHRGLAALRQLLGEDVTEAMSRA
ncbi:MAG: sigma-70 family RNA polymerase sigma factor [Mycobacteriales bacterium]|nr:sigma-70 family RNA polymerase sigma factor [Frankia sp.]